MTHTEGRDMANESGASLTNEVEELERLRRGPGASPMVEATTNPCWVRLDILGTSDGGGPIEVGIGSDPVWITPEHAAEFADALNRAALLAAHDGNQSPAPIDGNGAP